MSISVLEELINAMSRLPGLGPRSARRIALHLLKNKTQSMMPLAQILQKTAENTVFCKECGNLDVTSPCAICTDVKRDKSILCVVEDVADIWAIERGSVFRGHYHVLGGTLSALDGIGPDQLSVSKLLQRMDGSGVEEVIIATNATVEGQTTAYYLLDLLTSEKVRISRLALGIPVGGELDYLDEGTLTAAFKARQPMLV